MLRRPFLSLAFLCAPLLVASCSSPDPAYYTLEPRPGPLAGPAVQLVELRRIGLAGYLDRPEIVRDNADYRLRLTSGERWGEPLGDLVARILAEDLGLRLPGTGVFTSLGSLSADPDATIELDLQRFDMGAAGQVVLLAQVSVMRGRARGSARAQTVRLTVPTAGPRTADQVAAMSEALGLLADRIAPLLRP